VTHTGKQTETILETLLARTIGSSPTTALRDVLAGDVPRSIRTYLLAEVACWLAEDLQKIPRFVQLRLDETGLHHVQKTLLQTLATSYSLTRSELVAALRVAVEFTESYITRPQWTLEQFAFGEEQTMAAPAILSRLEYLAEYAYFPRLLEGILRRRLSREISREEFRHLLGQIDDQIVKQHNPRELALLTKPIFDFFLLRNATLEDPIPLRPVLLFFEDKKMNIMKEYIESICRLRGTETISLTALISLIEELYIGQTPEPPTEEEPATEPPPAGVEQPPQEQGNDIALAPITADLRPPAPSAHANLEPRAAVGGELPLGAELPDIQHLISEKQRQRFVRRIFKKDLAYYTGVVRTLNTMTTWEEASAYLQHIYEIHNLDPFSPDVVEFTDAVQNRYNTPDEPVR
jgi:hypothetical protein